LLLLAALYTLTCDTSKTKGLDMVHGRIGRLIAVVILFSGGAFVTSQIVIAAQGQQTRRIQEESYITNVYNSYRTDLRECISLSSSQNQAIEEEAERVDDSQIISTCLQSVNDQRQARILVDWGRSDLLETADSL